MRPLLSAVLGVLLCAAPAAAQPLEAAIDHYLAGRFSESIQILDSLLQAEPDNADARVWLAENHLRTDNPEGAMANARAVLQLEPCNAAAHNVVASVYSLELWEAEGRDSTWAHARRAVECEPEDGNSWLTYWVSGMMRQDSAAQALAQRRIGELRFVPEPLMELGRWILRSAPPNAVLFANGDWDFFPMMIAQSREGLRPDVTVALVGMLEVPWYVRRLVQRTGWPLPAELAVVVGDDWAPADEYAGQLGPIAGQLWAQAALDGGQPLTIPLTAVPDFVGDVAWIRWDGPVFTLLPWDQAPRDTTLSIHAEAFAASMRHLEIARLHGPVFHPTDRSPIRRATTHPASTILLGVAYYAAQSVAAGRMDDARQALAWADALVATGGTTEQDRANVEEFRASLPAGAP